MEFSNINKEIYELEQDHLYHLGIDINSEIRAEFCNIKYVVYTRSNFDIQKIANKFAKQYYKIDEDGFSMLPIYKTERYNLYKIGQVLFLSHGIGSPSLLIALNEVAKLLIHASCQNFIFVKINSANTSLFGDSVIHLVTDALNSELGTNYINIECGLEVSYPTNLDQDLLLDIQNFNQENMQLNLGSGKSLSSDGALLDSVINFDPVIVEQYIKMARQRGVCSIDLESDCFAGFCSKLNIRALILNYAENSELAKNNAEDLLTCYILSKVMPSK